MYTVKMHLRSEVHSSCFFSFAKGYYFDRLVFSLGKLRKHLITDFIHIAHYAVVAIVEDRSGRVTVDGYEGLRINAGNMVYRSGYAEADVEFGLYHATGLTKL